MSFSPAQTSPELQTHEGSLIIATWDLKYNLLSTKIIICLHTSHSIVQGRNLGAIFDSSSSLPSIYSPSLPTTLVPTT